MPGTTRRQLLRAASKPALNLAQSSLPSTRGAPAPTPSLEAHAANRLMFGPRAGDVASIQQKGYDAWLAEQLNPTSINDTACSNVLAGFPQETLSETWAQLYDRRSHATYSEAIKPFTQVRQNTVIRMAYSKRQLFERMVDFWHNHFNIYGLEFIVRSMFTKWDETIRTHALGNFRTFLEATASHPCMLYYLDNYISTDGGPNENYARELFELHALGAMNYQVEGGYIDQDVYESSRCFTGWTFERGSAVAERGQFKYVNDDHDRFLKFVLGSMIPNDQPPLKDGRDVLDRIAYHEGTARHIAWKLCVRFVGDDPPESIIASTAAKFIQYKNDSDQIKKVLDHLLKSTEFKDSRMVKFKRPVDWMISTMRALNYPYPNHDSFYWDFNNQGQRFFEWSPPNGPPDFWFRWATSNGMLQRWNYVLHLSAGWWDDNGFDYSVTGIMPGTLQTAREIVQFWLDRIIQRPVSEATMEGLMQYMSDGRNYDLDLPAAQISDRLKDLAGLICLTPEFQRR